MNIVYQINFIRRNEWVFIWVTGYAHAGIYAIAKVEDYNCLQNYACQSEFYKDQAWEKAP